MDPGALLGADLAGRYRLLRHLGDGRLGVSFEASTGESSTLLAVKVVPRSVLSDDALSRYLQLVAASSSIRNVHLVGTRDVAYDLGRGFVVFARDLLPSPDLGAFLAQNGPLAPLAAARLVAQACDGIASAHAVDVVHGNIKPTNVFLQPDDDGRITVRVCDPLVGLASTARLSGSWEHLRYSAPELVSGAKGGSREVGRRSDVFSLGAVLYALMTGTPPRTDAASPEALAEVQSWRDRETVQDRAPWVPAPIAEVVDRAMSHDPSQRFSSAQTLGSALRELAGGDVSLTRDALVPMDPALRGARQASASRDHSSPPGAEVSSVPDRDPLVGHRLGGRYRVLRALGRGGMGTVYEVEGARGERFAVKVISGEAAGRDTKLVARFIREAHSVTKIDDVHVTRTIELGTDMTLGVPFLVMELLHGQDLGALFKRRGAIEPVPLLRVFAQAAMGLRAAHEKGIIHRDVKPANIFLHASADGTLTVKICDFGLAKALQRAEDEAPSHDLTRTGGVIGTPMYMSPEHAVNPREVDARTDIWSLCASLYEGLSGQKLWGSVGSTMAELMLAICTRPFAPLADTAPWVSRPIAAIVEKGLARQPGERWPDLGAMLAALAPHLAGGTDVSMEALGSVDPGRLSARRLPVRKARGAASNLPTRPEGAGGGIPNGPEGLSGLGVRGLGFADTVLPHSSSALTGPPSTPRAEEDPSPSRPGRFLRVAAAGAAAVAALSAGTWFWSGSRARRVASVVDAAVAPARECAKNAECVKGHGGEPWICGPLGHCAPLASEDCKVLAEPGAVENDETVWFGTMFPLTGALATMGTECSNAVELARREFSTVSAGLPRNGDAPAAPLGLVACDDSTDPARVATHLVQDVHVPAVIGFRASNEAIDLASRFFIPSRALTIATLNHSPLITQVPQPADGPRLVWSLADSYGQTPEVMSLLIRQVIEPELRATGGLGPHERMRAAAILTESATGLGTEDSLLENLRINDRRALDNHDDFRVYRCDAAGASSTCEQYADAIVAFRPHVIIHVLTTVLVPLFRKVEERWPASAGFRPQYLENSELDGLEAFLDEKPERRQRMLGLTPPYNDASAKLTRRYNAAFHSHVEETEIPAEQYDAFYLLAFAAFAEKERPRDGRALADAFRQLLPPAESVEVGPSTLLEVFSRLSRGERVALNGASSLIDVDVATGERRSDFDVICPGVRDGRASGSVPSGLRYDHIHHTLKGTRACP